MKPILEIAGISKQYKICGSRSPKTDNFRELLLKAASAPFRALAGRKGDGEAKVEPYIFWALKDVTFHVNQGDVIGIIGRNGAGKSTLLKVLSRITTPSEGAVTVRAEWPACSKLARDFIQSLPAGKTFF